jgi:hypothetical protein
MIIRIFVKARNTPAALVQRRRRLVLRRLEFFPDQLLKHRSDQLAAGNLYAGTIIMQTSTTGSKKETKSS